MTCKAFTEAVTDYLEESLNPPLWVGFQAHLGGCLGCRTYFDQTKQTVRALRLLPTQPPPPAVREALLQRFRALYAN